MKELPILEKKNAKDLNQFIEYWSKLYSYPLEKLYNERIWKKQFDIADIQSLFVWKNGMNLSELKQKSLNEKIKPNLKLINRWKLDSFDLNSFEESFSNLSAVWKIFLLHIIKPNMYPIYDQNIHRAFNYIHNLEYSNISSSLKKKEKEDFYFNKYLCFIDSIENINLKKLDEAFFSFGKFINTRINSILVK